jgi:hypothetical protein
MRDDRDDKYTVYSDTNNRGLTTGILMDVLNRLDKGDKIYVEGHEANKVLSALSQIEVGEEE